MKRKHVYQSPDVIVCDCVLEGGFAMSVMSEQYGYDDLNSMYSSSTEKYGEGSGNLYDLMGNTSRYEGESQDGNFWNYGSF